jgi:hypothetical protein
MRSGTIALALAGQVLLAHHALHGTYDLKQEVKLEGRIVTVLLRNPHSFLQIEVPGEDGKLERWAVECSSANALGKRGITRATLHIGDEVSVTMNPPRRPNEKRGALKTLQVTKPAPPKRLLER